MCFAPFTLRLAPVTRLAVGKVGVHVERHFGRLVRRRQPSDRHLRPKSYPTPSTCVALSEPTDRAGTRDVATSAPGLGTWPHLRRDSPAPTAVVCQLNTQSSGQGSGDGVGATDSSTSHAQSFGSVRSRYTSCKHTLALYRATPHTRTDSHPLALYRATRTQARTHARSHSRTHASKLATARGRAWMTQEGSVSTTISMIPTIVRSVCGDTSYDPAVVRPLQAGSRP